MQVLLTVQVFLGSSLPNATLTIGHHTTSQRSSSNFLVGKKVPPLQTQCYNLFNNYTEMERRNDGNFLITQQISDALRTKIAQGLITPW